jgi:hypothetical protein
MSRVAFAPRLVGVSNRVRTCHRKHKQVELLDDEPERHYRNAGAHPSEKRSLVGRMITVAGIMKRPWPATVLQSPFSPAR